MKILFDVLPICRKERYWTSCVLPLIICRDRFMHLRYFLELAGIPDRFIKNSYNNAEILFYTECNLKESALDWEETEAISNTTPDIVILLNIDEDKYLMFVEAKMYTLPCKEGIRRQLDEQREIADVILEKNDIARDNFRHMALFLGHCEGFIPGYNEVVCYWDQIVDKYAFFGGDYFYEILKYGAKSKHLMSEDTQSSGKNSTSKLSYEDIEKELEYLGKDFYVGRDMGINTLKSDIDTGEYEKRKYEVNTELDPAADPPPNQNWFTAEEFINMVKQK